MHAGCTSSAAKRASRAAATLTLAAALGACSLFRQDGWDDAPRTFEIPVRNATNETPPYERVMGNPLPDHAWLRERASECEPWQVGLNGCAAPRVEAAVHTTAPHTTTRPVRRTHHAKPACTCIPQRKIPGS